MNGKRRVWRRIAFGLLAVIMLVVAGFGTLVWSMRPVDVPPAPPVLPSGPTAPVSVTIASGALEGYRDADIVAFKGIPYAAPPVGALRWRAPQPAISWTGVRKATAFGNDCWQIKQMYEAARPTQQMNEDCLTINVWAPAAPAKGVAPVMVWIHGGGFVIGGSSQPVSDGSALARQGVVVVTFNYRLGRFGFFAHPALSAEAPGQPTGNWGLMDQLAALQWVHANIAKFGGNPGAVTIFGQSAGGASVAQLMLEPGARGLFTRAIIESSGGRNHWTGLDHGVGNQPSGLAAGMAFASEQGLANATAAQLRAIPPEKVLGDISMSKLSSKSYVGPMIDGGFVASNFVDGFVAGREARVPLIVGSTDRELSALPWLVRRALRGWARSELRPALGSIRAAYGSSAAFDDDIVNDWGFAEPARTMAREHAAHGAPTWLYRFGYVSDARRDKLDGAPHASEIPFLFRTLGHEGVTPTNDDWAAARTISGYWLAFAKGGAPDAPGSPRWPSFDQGDLLMAFTAAGAKAEPVPRSTVLDAISARYNQNQ